MDTSQIAVSVAHGAAVLTFKYLQPPAAAEAEEAAGQTAAFDLGFWPSNGEIRVYQDDDTSESAVLALADYATRTKPAGETLFRKAASLGIHDRGAHGWPDAPAAMRAAYEVFARTVVNAADTISAVLSPPAGEPTQRRGGPKLEDSIFEKEEPTGAQDPEAVKAQQLEAERQAQAAKEEAKRKEREAKAAEKAAEKTAAAERKKAEQKARREAQAAAKAAGKGNGKGSARKGKPMPLGVPEAQPPAGEPADAPLLDQTGSDNPPTPDGDGQQGGKGQ